MDNGAFVLKSPRHMANKPACTHEGPADKQVCGHAHAYTQTHRQIQFQAKKLQTGETHSEYQTWGWDLKLLFWHLEIYS